MVPPISLACLEVKRPGHEADHSCAPSAEVKNGFIPTCLHKLSWRDAKLSTGQFSFTHSVARPRMCLCMCMCSCVMLLTH